VSEERPESPPPGFDYFGDRGLADSAALSGAEPPRLDGGRRRRRLRWSAVTATLFLAVSIWFLLGYRDLLGYAFSAPRPPQQLGDVVDLVPSDIPDNSFVALSGITEHRGLRQKLVRGLVPLRREYWYFRLLGSRGVFIEVPPDPDKFAFTTEVHVSGRAVDPERSILYRSLLTQYQERFFTSGQKEARIIQVGIAPGEGRLPFYVLFALIGAVAVFDVAAIVRLRRAGEPRSSAASPPPS
jgi:hypothetical protein